MRQNRYELLLLVMGGLGVMLVFFYKTFFQGLVPFPGDNLLSEYKPWQSYSFAGYHPGAIPNKAQYPDTIRQLYPWRTLVTEELKAGRLPLWNPYNFSGAPLAANFQSAVFYPPHLLYLILPQIVAWTALVILQPLLAFIFTYWYCRKIGASRLASWFGGISYAFSLFATVWLEYNTIGQVILWLPLALLSVENLGSKPTWVWFGLLVLSLSSALLAGHPQLAFYLLVFTLIYTWWRGRYAVKLALAAIILSTGISAIVLVPGLELIANSARSPHDFSFLFEKILIQPWQLLMLAVPNLFGHPATRTYWPADTFVGKVTYIGLVPLFFLLAALRLKSHLVGFFAAAAAVVLLLATANPVTYILFYLNLPIFSASSPTLMVFLMSFSLVVVVTQGIDQWTKEKHSLKKLGKRTVAVATFFVILWFVFTFLLPAINLISPQHLRIAQKAILYSGFLAAITLTGFLVAVIRPKYMIPTITLLLLVQLGDLFVQFHKFNPFVPANFVFPPTPIIQFLQAKRTDLLNSKGPSLNIDRFWGHGAAAIEANFATQYRLFSPNGYDPLYPRWYGEFIQASKEGKIGKNFSRETRSDAFITPSFGDSDIGSNKYRLRVLDLLGVKYILDRAENGSTQIGFPPDRYQLIYNQDGWKVYENKQTAPRAFLISDYQVFKTREEFEKLFFDDTFEVTKTVLLEKPLSVTLESPQSSDGLSIVSYQPTEITIRSQTHGTRLLFLSDVYYPGWKAIIDNQPAEIYRANYAFRAVAVPQGNHQIRLVYEPASATVGIIVSLISVLLTVLVLLILTY